MASKALLFKDQATYNKLTTTKVTPSDAKNLGKQVKNFNEVIWRHQRDYIAIHVLYHKFAQNDKFAKILLDSGNRAIIEASSTDAIWGIGYNIEEAISNKDQKRWGMNLLGQALMGVRELLQEDQTRCNATMDQTTTNKNVQHIAVKTTLKTSKEETTTPKEQTTGASSPLQVGQCQSVSASSSRSERSERPDLSLVIIPHKDWQRLDKHSLLYYPPYNANEWTEVPAGKLGGRSLCGTTNAIVQSLSAQHPNLTIPGLGEIEEILIKYEGCARTFYKDSSVAQTVKEISDSTVVMVIELYVQGRYRIVSSRRDEGNPPKDCKLVVIGCREDVRSSKLPVTWQGLWKSTLGIRRSIPPGLGDNSDYSEDYDDDDVLGVEMVNNGKPGLDIDPGNWVFTNNMTAPRLKDYNRKHWMPVLSKVLDAPSSCATANAIKLSVDVQWPGLEFPEVGDVAKELVRCAGGTRTVYSETTVATTIHNLSHGLLALVVEVKIDEMTRAKLADFHYKEGKLFEGKILLMGFDGGESERLDGKGNFKSWSALQKNVRTD